MTPARKKIIVIGVAGVLAVAALVGLSAGRKDRDAKPATNPPLEFAAADLAKVERRSLTRVLAFSGALQPLLQTTVKAKVAGEVAAVRVREGAAVRQGDLLLSIDTVNLRAQLDSQQAALERAKAEYAIAAKNRQNSASLLAQKFISQNAFDATHAQYDAAAANVRAAEAQLRLAQTALKDASVAAPQAGIVARRFVQPGEKVSVDSPLLSIVDLGRLEIEAPVTAAEVASVRVGQIARFRVDGFAGREFEGRVERINPLADGGSRAITIYIGVTNPEALLRGGMFAQGTLELEKTPEMAVIPTGAVREEAGTVSVMAIEDGRLARREVSLGLRDEASGLVELRSGLAEGAVIVRQRIPGLKPGSAVAVRPAG